MFSGHKWRGLETTLSRINTAAQLTDANSKNEFTSGAATILTSIVDGTDAVSFFVMRPKAYSARGRAVDDAIFCEQLLAG